LKQERENKIDVVIGIDIGSVTAKTVILDQRKQIVGYSVVEEGLVNEGSAIVSMRQALEKAGLSQEDVKFVVTTGYGRNLLHFHDKSFSEISCHARGAHGGGKVESFQMNDKCAAGTGRFLEVMSRALKLSFSEMGELGAHSQHPSQVSSMCTVFAESEIVSLAAQGISKSDIVAGLYESIARRTLTLMGMIQVRPKVMMTGGVAKNKQLVKVLEAVIKMEIVVPPEPQIVGALGAALMAHQAMGEEA
jgi:activator of 2-hydroxyglutaryl-CoA dehydratase